MNHTYKSGDRLIRLPEVLCYVGVGKSTWWAGVKEGRFPQSVKLGARTTAWRMSDIQTFMADPMGYKAEGLKYAA